MAMAEKDDNFGCESSDYCTSDEEGTDDYSPGGYHAVLIGESFNNGRYVVQGKLGWGHFSTVWLAWDTHRSQYVALKVQKSAQHYTESAFDEIAILQRIAEGDPDDRKCVVKLLDHFMHSGPNGQHVCMVFEYLGDTLLALMKHTGYRGLPIHVVKEICFHILVALDYLHWQLSIIHTDLKPENVLLLSVIDPTKDPRKSGFPLVQAGSERVVSAGAEAVPGTSGTFDSCASSGPNLGTLESLPTTSTNADISDTDGAKGNGQANNWASTNCKCKLIDFGNSCWTYKHVTDNIQTRQYRCPEVILGSKYSTSADLWSFACICFELATGDVLFDPHRGPNHDRDEDHLALMIDLLGMMPREIALGGRYSLQFFDINGDLRRIQGFEFWPLNKVLMERYEFNEKDANDMSDFLLPILDFVPEKRPTAGQCLLHPWINPGPRLLEPSVP